MDTSLLEVLARMGLIPMDTPISVTVIGFGGSVAGTIILRSPPVGGCAVCRDRETCSNRQP